MTAAMDLDALARVRTALADPIRQRVLVELVSGPRYPTELAELVGTSRATCPTTLPVCVVAGW
ncbi:MAG TPA: winged helix-turn-helix domain-containing protein [Nitriliruptorales bacterium]|nr:winged helix-turn-helix domain-containing protein [Nitriliruptorales bacterium]